MQKPGSDGQGLNRPGQGPKAGVVLGKEVFPVRAAAEVKDGTGGQNAQFGGDGPRCGHPDIPGPRAQGGPSGQGGGPGHAPAAGNEKHPADGAFMSIPRTVG